MFRIVLWFSGLENYEIIHPQTVSTLKYCRGKKYSTLSSYYANDFHYCWRYFKIHIDEKLIGSIPHYYGSKLGQEKETHKLLLRQSSDTSTIQYLSMQGRVQFLRQANFSGRIVSPAPFVNKARVALVQDSARANDDAGPF